MSEREKELRLREHDLWEKLDTLHCPHDLIEKLIQVRIELDRLIHNN